MMVIDSVTQTEFGVVSIIDHFFGMFGRFTFIKQLVSYVILGRNSTLEIGTELVFSELQLSKPTCIPDRFGVVISYAVSPGCKVSNSCPGSGFIFLPGSISVGISRNTLLLI